MEWKDIPGYEGMYQVNAIGYVRSLQRLVLCRSGAWRLKKMKILKQSTSSDGYLRNALYLNGKIKTTGSHRLVAMAFIPNPNNKPCINHKNGIKTDNRVENLEWCTVSENNNHATKMFGYRKGEQNGMSKLNESKVKSIRKDYVPYKTTRISLAKKYGITKSMVDKILSKANWK